MKAKTAVRAAAFLFLAAVLYSCGFRLPWARSEAAPVPVVTPPGVSGPNVAAGSTDPIALYEAGRFEQVAGEYYRAIERYLSALELNPAYAEAIAALAECYYALDEYDEALIRVREASRYRRDDPSLRVLEGFCLLGLGDAGKASAIFGEILKARPNDLDARFGLALIDLRAGKYSDAERKFGDALRVSPGDEKTLLSLALLKLDSGDAKAALAFVEETLLRFGDEPRVHYVAARVALAVDDPDWGTGRAIREAKLALELRPGFDAARRFLAALLYENGDFEGAAALAEISVARNREDSSAWYTLGLARGAQDRFDDALYAFGVAAGLRPDDETARIALEDLVMGKTRLEDSVRVDYANAHFSRAAGFAGRNEFERAFFEYRRGLRVYPYSKPGRQGYAKLLKLRGRVASYYQELTFLADIGKADQWTLDELDNTGSVLSASVAAQWKINQFALAKRPYGIAMYGLERTGQPFHTSGDLTLSGYLGSLLDGSSKIRATGKVKGVSGFADAFRGARESGSQYFGMITVMEAEREVGLRLDLYVGRSGAPAFSYAYSASGNDRVARTAVNVAQALENALPVRGRIIDRKGERVAIDLGANDGIAKGDVLLVLRGASVGTAPEGVALEWAAKDELATITVTTIDEEVSDGVLVRNGFFDSVNVRDEVVRKPQAPAVPAAAAKPVPQTAPALPESFGLPEAYRDIERLW
ncbi:MAG: tetratricopeptide repeat protein [Spirochaetes bacterium]|nr:tetratricopeptide repeat protein [Spirochaetota bacterium]